MAQLIDREAWWRVRKLMAMSYTGLLFKAMLDKISVWGGFLCSLQIELGKLPLCINKNHPSYMGDNEWYQLHILYYKNEPN